MILGTKVQNLKLKTQSHISKCKTALLLCLSFSCFIAGTCWAGPQVTTNDSFSFLVWGDNRDVDETFVKLIEKVNRQSSQAAFAVNTGDFVPAGKKIEYYHYRKLLKPLKLKSYHVPGNHDLVRYGCKYFQEFYAYHHLLIIWMRHTETP